MTKLNIANVIKSHNENLLKNDIKKEQVIEDEELKDLFKGVILSNTEVLALNSMSNTTLDFNSLKSAIRALKGQQTTTMSRNSGRKKKTLPVSKEIVELRHSTGESYESIAKSYDMSRTTLYYLINDIK